jgi:YVTN family beta-propeller protein
MGNAISWRVFWVLAFLAVLACPYLDGLSADAPPARLRRPLALLLTNHGQQLLAANHSSGSITIMDTDHLRPLAEVPIGKGLADLALVPDGRRVLAVDEEGNELVVLTLQAGALEVSHRVPIVGAPVSVRLASDGSRCFVAAQWARRLLVVDLTTSPPLVTKAIPLPFAPRCQLPIGKEDKVIVTDAFGGRLAVVDVRRGVVEPVRSLPAHNIRGLALSADGKQVLLAHQVLNGNARTTREDIHWGNVIVNTVRSLSLAKVLSPEADLLAGSEQLTLGDVGHGAGDPASLTIRPDGKMVVALGGIGEIALGPEKDGTWQYVKVGQRPTATALGSDGRRVYVASTFADTISVVDSSSRKVMGEVRLGPQPELTASDRGELSFYDAQLTHDGWFSCHSCHTDGHTNGLLNDNLGDNSYGAPKRVLSLRGVKDTAPFAWNGGMPDLEGQVRKSLLTTMHSLAANDKLVRDLTAYLRSLPPPPPLAAFDDQPDRAAVEHGREVFQKQSCATCHAPPLYTSAKTFDVGLADEVGNTAFNPPSLRGVSQGGPYFHDNRAATLEEVFTRHRHQLKSELTKQELADLLSFLRGV